MTATRVDTTVLRGRAGWPGGRLIPRGSGSVGEYRPDSAATAGYGGYGGWEQHGGSATHHFGTENNIDVVTLGWSRSSVASHQRTASRARRARGRLVPGPARARADERRVERLKPSQTNGTAADPQGGVERGPGGTVPGWGPRVARRAASGAARRPAAGPRRCRNTCAPSRGRLQSRFSPRSVRNVS